MQTLEDELSHAFYVLKVAPEYRLSIHNYLHLLKKTDEKTYNHSIAVGIQSSEIAEYLGLNPKAGLFTGTLHDIGKIQISPDILRKTAVFSEYDMTEIRKHPIYSYLLLKGVHDFSAEVALRHHKCQKEGYPEIIPESKIPFSDDTKKLIEKYAEIVALADFYNAINSRKNEKFGNKRLSDDEAKDMFLENHPNQANLIEELYKNTIFVKTILC